MPSLLVLGEPFTCFAKRLRLLSIGSLCDTSCASCRCCSSDSGSGRFGIRSLALRMHENVAMFRCARDIAQSQNASTTCQGAVQPPSKLHIQKKI